MFGLLLLTAKGLDPESPGIILYDVNTTKQTILFTAAAVEGPPPKLGDKVSCKRMYGFVTLTVYVRLSVRPDYCVSTLSPSGSQLF